MPRTPVAKEKLLTAALALIRERGFSATSVDDLCARAGVTKGAFFHHFSTKEQLGVEAAEHWSKLTAQIFAAAGFHRHPDPLDRVLGYIAFRRALLRGELWEFTCVAGSMVQETYLDHPEIRVACGDCIFDHAATLVEDIKSAMKIYGAPSGFTAESLATHTQVVLQGAFILAKAGGGLPVAIDSVDHLARYVRLLFSQTFSKHPKEKSHGSSRLL